MEPLLEGQIDLHQLISDPGFDCIVETIFTNLDSSTLANCRLVAKSWKDLIDTRKSLLVRQLGWLKTIKLELLNAKEWYKMRTILQPGRKCSPQ